MSSLPPINLECSIFNRNGQEVQREAWESDFQGTVSKADVVKDMMTKKGAAAPTAAEGACGAGGNQGLLDDIAELKQMFHKQDTSADIELAAGLARAKMFKEKGNAQFKAKNDHEAKQHYLDARGALQAAGVSGSGDSTGCSSGGGGAEAAQAPNPADAGANHLLHQIQLNIAAAEMRLCNWAAAVEAATVALEIDPSSSKALYRRGLALSKLEGRTSDSLTDLKRALQQEPGSADVRRELAKITGGQAVVDEVDEAMQASAPDSSVSPPVVDATGAVEPTADSAQAEQVEQAAGPGSPSAKMEPFHRFGEAQQQPVGAGPEADSTDKENERQRQQQAQQAEEAERVRQRAAAALANLPPATPNVRGRLQPL
jgi:hypothetical protein